VLKFVGVMQNWSLLSHDYQFWQSDLTINLQVELDNCDKVKTHTIYERQTLKYMHTVDVFVHGIFSEYDNKKEKVTFFAKTKSCHYLCNFQAEEYTLNEKLA